MSTPPAVVGADGAASSIVNQAPGLGKRLFQRPLAVVCIGYLLGLLIVAVLAPVLLPGVDGQNAGDLAAARQGPSGDHVLGTDSLGRDVAERLLVGTRVSLLGVAEALLVVLVLGVPLGVLAGFLGGWTDRAVSFAGDLVFSMPGIIVILVVLTVFPQSLTAAMLAFGLLAAPALMRVVRSATLPVREELYIAAARVSGLSRSYIMARHVVPRIAGAVIVQAALLSATALLVQSGLAFLGLVVNAPAASWGGMLKDGVSTLFIQPWLIWPPGIMIATTILVLGLLADAVRDATTEAWAPAVRARRRPSDRTARTEVRPTEPVSREEAGALLVVRGLTIGFDRPDGTLRVADDVTFGIQPGETVGLVGESGCGKTITAMGLLGLLPGTGHIEAGSILFNGRDLAATSERELRRVRGREIALISQEPVVGLNPVLRVGTQLTEVVRRHNKVSRKAARARVLELLTRVHLPDPESVARRYPHELSGGMAQRIGIARALAGSPRLLIADEPTTALDVTVQAEILDVLRQLQRDTNMALLLVTHDWGVVADICQRVVVMYAGQVVERASVSEIFSDPRHPYTAALLASDPHQASEAEVLPAIPGRVPQPGLWPSGCHFHPRCTYASAACRETLIPMERPGSRRETRCIHHDQLVRSQ